jgi:hypothetical protein
MPRKLDAQLRKAQASETNKRFRELREIAQLSFAENKTLLTGLLEFDSKRSAFSVPTKPSKTGCIMPANKPLEDRLRCSRIASQVHKADECKPNDQLVAHTLLVASAALVYELDYVRRETLRWHPGLGSLAADEKGAPKIEKYRSGKELEELVQETAEWVSGMVRDHRASGVAEKCALALSAEMVSEYESIAYSLTQQLQRQKLCKSMKVMNYCTPTVGTFIATGFVIESMLSAVRVFKWQYREIIINAVSAAALQPGSSALATTQFSLGVRSLIASELLCSLLELLSKKCHELGGSQLASAIKIELFRAVLQQVQISCFLVLLFPCPLVSPCLPKDLLFIPLPVNRTWRLSTAGLTRTTTSTFSCTPRAPSPN